jgi:polar amino acid transport system substrate-binding protein
LSLPLLLIPFLGILPSSVQASDSPCTTVQEVEARGSLRWGADAEGGAPYVFPDPRNPRQFIGFEVDLARSLAAKLGVRAEMVQNSWDGLVSALDRGSFDIILNGLEITPEHLGQISMSRPYYAYTQQIVTRAGDGSMQRLEDLKGKRVGILSASVAHRLLEKMGGVDIRVYPGNVETCKDLKNRRIDASVMDTPIALHYAKPDPGLQFSGKPFAVGYYGVGVRKKDAKLLEAMDRAIVGLLASGELRRIYLKWGLWDPEQEKRLRKFTPVEAPKEGKVSTLREWRTFLPMLLKGAVVTVEISCLSMLLAVGLGLGLALSRIFGVTPLRWLATAYIEVIRGTPLLIQLYMIYYGLPNLGIRLTSFEAAVIGLGMNYAAYEAENYRAGIQAIPEGQMEAALSLGMTRWQALRRVVLPQAIRIVIPPISNDFIALFKDSSLVSVITMVELTKVYGMLATTTYDYMGLGLMTAAIYFGLSYPASLAAKFIERKLRYDFD